MAQPHSELEILWLFQANFISSITLDAGSGYSGHLNKSCSLSKFTSVEMHKCRKNSNNMPVGD